MTASNVSMVRLETIVQLLSTASAALEYDLDTARACIARANKLLRASAEQSTSRPTATASARTGLAPWKARRILLHINTHLTERLQVSDLARIANLSTSHFSRAFRETFGLAPKIYVTKRRLHRAQELMLCTYQPLAQVALQCGLCDQSHLTRLFRRYIGANPSVWRRQFGTRNPSHVDLRVPLADSAAGNTAQAA